METVVQPLTAVQPPTAKNPKSIVLPVVLGALLVICILIIILYASHVIDNTPSPNVKLFCSDSKDVKDPGAAKITFLVQVKQVSEISADGDATLFIFLSQDVKHEIASWKIKLSDFAFTTPEFGSSNEKITLTYAPKSNEFDIKVTETLTQAVVLHAICTQKDSLDFLIQ